MDRSIYFKKVGWFKMVFVRIIGMRYQKEHCKNGMCVSWDTYKVGKTLYILSTDRYPEPSGWDDEYHSASELFKEDIVTRLVGGRA